MIKRIKIDGYKSFRCLDLQLRPLTVIFGPNASGKSNFLDALYLLSRAVTAKNLNEAFKEHRGLPLESFYYGEEGYEGLLKQSNPRFFFEVDDLFVCRKEGNQTTIRSLPGTSLLKRQFVEQGLENRILRGEFGG